jgi:NAD(P)-dependent dehydrogenase (short-subunit alcohol dehydrogenase family)
MSWYDYVACLFAGTFLANVLPHFVHGISGDSFPTPFARPLVKGLSSPTANVAWALVNLVVGYVLFRAGKVSSGDGALAAFFAGIVNTFAYDASKAALNSFTIHLAYELRDNKIKVNSAHPGWVKTEMGGPNAPMEVSEGRKTGAQLATLPEDGPNGSFYHLGQPLPW